MKLLLHYLFILFLILPGFTTAESTLANEVRANFTENNDKNDEDTDAYESEDEGDEEDEDKVPENEIATMYENGRMAFLFGKFDIVRIYLLKKKRKMSR